MIDEIGATRALLSRLTAARAALLDEITAARLAELDAANIPADVDLIYGSTGAIEGATTLHNKLTAARAALLDQITALRLAELDAANIPADIDTLKTNSDKRVIGKIGIFVKAITSAANAGAVVAATITTQGCLIKSIVVRSNGATTADLTNITITGGAGGVVSFIDAVTGVRANIAAADQQVAWTGAVSLAATKTISITLTGTGVAAVDLTLTFEYEAQVDGGYLV